MKNINLNVNQIEDLRELIHQHLHQFINNKKAAAMTFRKIKNYGFNTMPDAIKFYREYKRNKCNSSI